MKVDTLLYQRKLEPSSPKKMAIGLALVALGYVVIAIAVKGLGLGEKFSMWWLIALYIIHSMGELCLSPMGLSLVSKLSPPRITALMMGGYFLAISVGNKLSGMLSSLWEGMDDKKDFFYLNFGLVLGAAMLLFFMLKWLNSVMKENNVQ